MHIFTLTFHKNKYFSPVLWASFVIFLLLNVNGKLMWSYMQYLVDVSQFNAYFRKFIGTLLLPILILNVKCNPFDSKSQNRSLFCLHCFKVLLSCRMAGNVMGISNAISCKYCFSVPYILITKIILVSPDLFYFAGSLSYRNAASSHLDENGTWNHGKACGCPRDSSRSGLR